MMDTIAIFVFGYAIASSNSWLVGAVGVFWICSGWEDFWEGWQEAKGDRDK